jgi:hypothetical protein
MKQSVNRRNKHFILDDNQLKLARKLIGAKSDTETVEVALAELINERQRNQQAWKATEKLIKSGIEVHDVFGRLDDK